MSARRSRPGPTRSRPRPTSLRGGNLGEDALTSAVDDLADATSDFVDDVRGLGAPDTEEGEQAKESLDQLADDADENLSTVQDAVDDVSGPSGIVAAVTAISGAIATMGQQFSSTFSELQQLDPGGELETAFNEADSCDELRVGLDRDAHRGRGNPDGGTKEDGVTDDQQRLA